MRWRRRSYAGHACRQFALVREVRRFTIARSLSRAPLPTAPAFSQRRRWARTFAYMGTRFIATEEARAVEDYKADDRRFHGAGHRLLHRLFTGIHGNYLKESVRQGRARPDNLPSADKTPMNFGQGRCEAWKDIWGSGRGVGPDGRRCRRQLVLVERQRRRSTVTPLPLRRQRRQRLRIEASARLVIFYRKPYSIRAERPESGKEVRFMSRLTA